MNLLFGQKTGIFFVILELLAPSNICYLIIRN